jgi:hypothetical protein
MRRRVLAGRSTNRVRPVARPVPVPNTNIAGTVGPQFDPKDIETGEIKRGGYFAEFGDRTFGAFNVVPRYGFEGNREGEVLVGYGSFHKTNPQFSLGDHSDRGGSRSQRVGGPSMSIISGRMRAISSITM